MKTMINSGLFSSRTDEWATPLELFRKLNEEFDFDLDPCATPENAKCERYFTKEQDGLAQSWAGCRVFCNPPYGKEIGRWMEKCWKEAQGGGSCSGFDTCPDGYFIFPRLYLEEDKRGAIYKGAVAL